MADKFDILRAAMHAEFPDGRSNAFAADELGSWEGPDIPKGLWEQQQWAGVTPAMEGRVAPPPGVPLVRIQLPRKFSRDWSVQFACPNPRGAGAFNNAGFTSTGIITLRWGHHGSMDEVLLTWPARGGAVTVHGSFVEVLYSDTSAVNNAAACWVDEGRASRTPQGFKPCFAQFVSTEPGEVPDPPGEIPPGGVAVVTLARRCRSFSLAFVSNGDVPVRVRQQEANANPLVDTRLQNNTAGTPGINENGNIMLAEVPVHHWATELEVTNESAIDTMLNTVLLQYLDLG
jgi:hypothetical protein